MFKNAFRFATTFGLLVAAYAGYTQMFALVSERLRQAQGTSSFRSAAAESKTKKQAIALGVQGFGRGHWTSDPDLPIRYYNSDRGFWMYAREYERLEDGKRLKFTPFALIWQSRDGQALKTVTSNAAVIDLDRPLGLVGPADGAGGAMRVVHARIEGDVQLRDDKGTPDPADDLRIKPGPYVEYDEERLEVTGDDAELVEINDRDLRITGVGLLIKLRPRPRTAALLGAPASASVGFDGAQTACLKKNVDIVIGDVGPGGILPGKPEGKLAPGEKTPLHLRCDGLMQIDLAKTRLPARVGPPAPPGPTLAQFFRNVEVVRGKPGGALDRLTCDHLHLTLLPGDKGAEREKAKAATTPTDPKTPDAPSGPLNELALRRARATGHNVQISSAAQGVKARCNELIHEKHQPDAPDETYFRGDATTKLVVEKVDTASTGPNRGKVTAFTTIRTIDATIFENGQGNDNATIVARGPGELEWRPGLDQRVERTARWDDTLTIEPDPTAVAEAARLARSNPNSNPNSKPTTAAPLGKRITMTGRPAFADIPTASALDASRTVVIWLRPKTRPPAATSTPATVANPSEPPAGPSFELERLVALKDVHLKAPFKTLEARDRLDAEFAPVVEPGKPGTTTAVVSLTTVPPAVPVAAAPSVGGPASVSAPAGSKPAKPSARPVEPEARARANVVWTRVRLRPDDGSSPAVASTTTPSLFTSANPDAPPRAEVEKVFLRGGVVVHQDPPAGKLKGTDVTGEAVDLVSQGKGLTRFIVFNHNPSATGGGGSPPPAKGKAGPAPLPGDNAPPAVIETEDMAIRGPVIGLDQATDQAWVEGRGTLTQMTTRGLLSDKSLPDARPAGTGLKPAATPPKKVPLTISWAREMKFFGQSTDLQGRPAARAEFYQDVHAEMEDSSFSCQDVMRTYLDRTVKLVKLKSEPPRPAGDEDPLEEGGAGSSKEPRPDVGMIEMAKKVVVVNVKRDPLRGNHIVEKQRIIGEYLVYEKASGKFRVPGKGEVHLYQLEGQANPLAPKLGDHDDAGPRRGPGDARVIRTSADGSVPPTAPAVGSVPRPLDRASGQGRLRAPAQAKDQPKARTPVQPGRKAAPPMVLTQVKFTRDMLGRFGSGKETDKRDNRWADFFGNVEALHGPVPSVDAVLDPDRLGADTQFITAQVLRVISEPNPAAPDAPPRYLMRAWENAYAVAGDKVLQADTLTYDSEKGLFYAYGEEGRDVVIAQQARIGQAASNVPGRAAIFNVKTGELELIEPKQMAWVDLRTGTRPRLVPAPNLNVPLQKPRRAPLRNPRGDIERKDFNGR